MVYSIQLTLSLLFDSIFGDPRWYPHPVRGIGWIIDRSESFYRGTIKNLRLGGTFTVITVIALTSAVVLFLLTLTSMFSP